MGVDKPQDFYEHKIENAAVVDSHLCTKAELSPSPGSFHSKVKKWRLNYLIWQGSCSWMFSVVFYNDSTIANRKGNSKVYHNQY